MLLVRLGLGDGSAEAAAPPHLAAGGDPELNRAPRGYSRGP